MTISVVKNISQPLICPKHSTSILCTKNHVNSQHVQRLGLMREVKDTFRIFQHTSRFPKVYERMFIGIKGQYTSPYLDDILCYRKFFDEHLDNLRTVLRPLKSYGIKRKTEKCFFFKKEKIFS